MVRRLGLTAPGSRAPRSSSARPTTQPLWVPFFTAALAAAAIAGALVDVDQPAMPSWPVAAGFLVALTAAALLNLRYYFRGEVDAIDQFEIALAPAIFFLPIPLLVVLVAVAKAVSQLLRGIAPRKALFNIAQWSAAAAAGGLTFAVLRGGGPLHSADLTWLAVAILVVAVVNSASLLLVMALVQRPRHRGWLPVFAATLIRDTGMALILNLSFGLLFVTTYAWARGASPLLLVPLAMLHWVSRGHAIGRVEQARLQVAQNATSALTTPAIPQSGFAAFCAELGRGFDRRGVDLVLEGPPEPALYSWRRRSGGSPDQADGAGAAVGPEEQDAATTEQAARLLEVLRGLPGPLSVNAATGDSDLRRILELTDSDECTVAPVRIGDEAVGYLCLYDAERAIAFPHRELVAVGSLASEVGRVVQNARLVAAMLEERQKLAQIVDESQDGIATLTADGKVSAWNPAFERLTGFSGLGVIGSPGLDVLQPRDADGNEVSLDRWAEDAINPPTELIIRTRIGLNRWLSCSYARAFDSTGRPSRLIIMGRDVSELKQAESLLAGQAHVLGLIASGAPLSQSLGELAASLADMREGGRSAVLLLDDSELQELHLVASTGVSIATLRAINAFRLTPLTSVTGAAVAWGRTIEVADVHADTTWPLLSGTALGLGVRSCWVEPIRASDTEQVLGVIIMLVPAAGGPVQRIDWKDVLQASARLAAIAVTRSAIESQLTHQASHDPLTGLPNRVVFFDRCEHALQRRRRFGDDVIVFFIDLDRFKLVNDGWGHEGGDQLLIAVAERLRGAMRETDTVARFGGDEFAVLCEVGAEWPQVAELVERVQACLAAPVSVSGGEVYVPASIGMAVSTTDIDAATLVGNADAAMYRAKQLGGNRCEIFEQVMRSPAHLRLSIHSDLHRALERDEFFMDYQPLVSLADDSMTGVEALVRWAHPERGVIAPNEFLALAESSGLIVPIGDRILTMACQQARRWQTELAGQRELRVNINLSPLQFLQSDVAHKIAQALDAAGVTPELIGLEITESAIMEDIEATAITMHELKDLGVSLIIDDFGTGYSSLTHLKRFPVDELKVDRSFVAGLGSSKRDGAIVHAVIALAHALDMLAVAEGVETADQRTRLAQLGCDTGQGFYFGRPRAASELFARARDGLLTRAADTTTGTGQLPLPRLGSADQRGDEPKPT